MAGAFVWHELLTTDAAAAAAFYTSVTGWTARDSGMPGVVYTLLYAGEFQVAGMMDLPREARDAGARPGWTGYVAVDDVDASAAQAKSLGGTVRMAPHDIPGVGRFAVIADPQGAGIALFRAQSEPPPSAAPMAPGTIAWNELSATDMPAVWPFYEAMFGWTKGDAIEMDPMGTYQFFVAGGAACGGMMTRPAEMPGPFWLYYVAVPDIDEAVARIGAAGGTVLMAPMQVPGDAWVIQGQDPQGVVFALVGQRPG